MRESGKRRCMRTEEGRGGAKIRGESGGRREERGRGRDKLTCTHLSLHLDWDICLTCREKCVSSDIKKKFNNNKKNKEMYR